jgi:P4 family phage/plasmid primase-like protien
MEDKLKQEWEKHKASKDKEYKSLSETMESIENWDVKKAHEKLMKEKKNRDLYQLRSSVIGLLKRKEYGQASELLVEELINLFKIYTTRDDKSSEIWIYKEGIVVPQGKSILKENLRQLMGDEYNVWLANQVMAKIETDTPVEPQEFFNTNYVSEVPVLNGILDLKTRELKPFDENKIFFNKLNAKYDPEAKCPEIENFLNSTFLTKEDVEVFYEIGGFCLWKEYKFEKAFMMVGNGRNGKDKSLELIKRMLGVENCCSVPLSSLKPESFILSEFFGKMANIAGEINNQDLKDTSEFKALTGRSMKTAPRKFLKPITFVNYAKFIFACNDLPMIYDVSKGFWDRWVLLEFPYTFVTQKELDEAKDKKNLKLRDENIIERISNPQEMSGLLNKFLDGLQRLERTKQFSSARGSEEIKALWIRKSNSVMAFCFDNVEEGYDGYISKKEFRKRYADFCKLHTVPTKSDYVIKRTMEEMYGAGEGNREILGSRWEKVWEGIKWKN